MFIEMNFFWLSAKDPNESISSKTLTQTESSIITQSSTITEQSKTQRNFFQNYKELNLQNKNDELISLVVEQITYVLNNLESIHVGDDNLLKYLTTNNKEEFCHLVQPICCTHNETISSLQDYSWITVFTTRSSKLEKWRPDRPDITDSTTSMATKPKTTTKQKTTIKPEQSKSSPIEFQKSLLVFPIVLVNICQILFWS